MLNVGGKCAVLWEAMQSFVDQQHDGIGNVKYRKELRYHDIKFEYYNHNRVVCECHMSRRRDHEPSRTPEKKVKRLSQKKRKLSFCRKGFLRSLHCRQDFMVT